MGGTILIFLPHDPLLFLARNKMKWKRNIDSPVFEVAVDEFT
jgi:hypothetical protein